MADWISAADWIGIAGQFLLGGFYVAAGVEHFFAVGPISEGLAGRGLPLAKPALIAASLFQIACGLFVMCNIWAGRAAFGLIGFTLLAGFLLVDFWNRSGAERAEGIRTWQSNAAIIGGLLVIAAQQRF